LVIILDFNWEAINKEYDIILSKGFSNSDIHNYITGKLETAGGNPNIFEDGAIQLINFQIKY